MTSPLLGFQQPTPFRSRRKATVGVLVGLAVAVIRVALFRR